MNGQRSMSRLSLLISAVAAMAIAAWVPVNGLAARPAAPAGHPVAHHQPDGKRALRAPTNTRTAHAGRVAYCIEGIPFNTHWQIMAGPACSPIQ